MTQICRYEIIPVSLHGVSDRVMIDYIESSSVTTSGLCGWVKTKTAYIS